MNSRCFASASRACDQKDSTAGDCCAAGFRSSLCRLEVKTSNAQSEKMFSGLPRKADLRPARVSSERRTARAATYRGVRLATDAAIYHSRSGSHLWRVFTRRVRATGIRDQPIAPHSPWQNGCAERLIGSIRRDCLPCCCVWRAASLFRSEIALLQIFAIQPTLQTGFLTGD
jgi:hypothetical protein